jgi:DNA-directed RNA polymerase specialized sigma24 family protein
MRQSCMAHSRTDDRSISPTGLARLLARLDPNPEQGAAEYENLRRVLVKFFDWRGAWPPEDCADVTLDRLARRLEENIEVLDVRNYALGVARRVFLERQRQPRHASIDEHPDLLDRPSAPAAAHDPRPDCLDRCLAQLPDDSRLLILEYYAGERRAKIVNRQRLASTNGLSDNALRSRTRRLRERLEACVRGCVASSSFV